MNAKKKIVAGLMTSLFLSGAQAEDLMDVFEFGVASDPTLLAARAQLSSTGEVERQAMANFLPQVSASGQLTRGDSQFSIAGIEVSDTDTDSENLNVQVQQTIYDHANYKQLDQARAQVSGAEADYEAAFQAFLLRAAERYFAVLTAEDALRFAGAEEEAVGRQLEQAEQRYEVGLTAITDVHEARARHDNSRARVIVAENQLDDAKEGLRELTGRGVASVDPLRAEISPSLPEPADAEQWVERGLNANPNLISRQMAVDAAIERVRLERSGHYPTVSASLSFNEFTNNEFILRDDFQNVLGNTSSVSDSAQIQLTLSVPIYSGGRTSSRVRQAAADHDAAQQRLETQRRQVVRNTRNAYRGTQASILEVEARNQALISAQSALEATEAGFEVGTRTIVDVLLSQQQLFQAQRDHSQARHDYILNKLRLKAAAGVLSRDDLNEVNGLLTP